MEELLKDHLGEIALLIYILYPLLKRGWDRLRKRESAKEPKKARSGRKRRREAQKAAQPKSGRRPKKTRPSPKPAAEASPASQFLSEALAQLGRTKRNADTLLGRAAGDPRLSPLVPALREDVLGRLALVESSLRSSPPLSTIVQNTTALRALDSLVASLHTMARQRTRATAPFLLTADEMARAFYAPLIELSQAQNLPLRTREPIAMTGESERSILPRFAATRLAPVRVPSGFEHSLWRWPAIAHEVAHDFFYSLEGLAPSLRTRLGLPARLEVPLSPEELDGRWLRGLFGAWLPEVFADVLGTVMLGPAYVETMRRAFRNPGSPQQTAAVLQDHDAMDEHPPPRIRLFMATRVLHQLGRHDEADALWERWETEHESADLYYLPLAGRWVGLADENLHSIASSIVETLVLRPWPELEGFQLLNIPGLAYLHSEHAETGRLSAELARGQTVQADARWVTAGAITAAAEQPVLHDQILSAAKRSLAGIEPAREPAAPTPERMPEPKSISGSLRDSLQCPDAIQEAIVLGAALTPYRRPRWRRR